MMHDQHSSSSTSPFRLSISGATGFVGSRLAEACKNRGYITNTVDFRASTHVDLGNHPGGDVFIHLAALAHADSTDEEQVYAVNRDLAVNAAQAAKSAGYRQFVFLSSALVWGCTLECVSRSTPENPDTVYGRAKLEAERAIISLESSSFCVTIVRPPLVYGPGVKGNLSKFLKAVHTWPLCPLGVTDNRRTMVNLDNLCELLLHLSEHNASGTFCAVDGPPVSSYDVLRLMTERMPRHARLFPMPRLLRSLLQIGAPATARRLLGSFVVEDDSAERVGFTPSYTMEQGFDAMVSHYLKAIKNTGRDVPR